MQTPSSSVSRLLHHPVVRSIIDVPPAFSKLDLAADRARELYAQAKEELLAHQPSVSLMEALPEEVLSDWADKDWGVLYTPTAYAPKGQVAVHAFMAVSYLLSMLTWELGSYRAIQVSQLLDDEEFESCRVMIANCGRAMARYDRYSADHSSAA